MKRITIALPDDLAEIVRQHLQAQEPPSTLTTVVQNALRAYLQERACLTSFRALRITPADRGSRISDLSMNHDRYFAEKE